MKKFKKVLSLIMGTALAVSSTGSLQANALAQFADSVEIEGYEQFDDHGLLAWTQWDGTQYHDYLAYWDKENHTSLAILQSAFFNDTCFTIDNASENLPKWKEIYSKYENELDYEYVNERSYADRVWISLWDRHDSDGNESFDVNAVPDKYDLIKNLCAELYEAGVIESADYSRFIMCKSSGNFYDISYFNVNSVTASEEELYNVVSTVDESLAVKSAEKEDGTAYLTVENIDTPDEFIAAVGAVKAAYPDASFSGTSAVFTEETETLSDSINLLDPYICDIDESGTADISDATQVLDSYANSAAGILQVSGEDKMDVNGDGTVDIADATYILTYYAEAAAGLR